jgi:transformer-2 protein
MSDYRPNDYPSAPRPRPPPAQVAPNNVLGVFGLSVRTRERDLEDEFGRYGEVEKAIIVYDQRVSFLLPRRHQ